MVKGPHYKGLCMVKGRSPLQLRVDRLCMIKGQRGIVKGESLLDSVF